MLSTPETDVDRLQAEVRRLAENHDQVVGWLRDMEAERDRYRHALLALCDRVERDRREPDKLLCAVLSARSDVTALEGKGGGE